MSNSLWPQARLSMGFSRQEYWSGLLFPSPGDLPDPRIEPASLALAGGFFTNFTTWGADDRKLNDSLYLPPGPEKTGVT